MPLEDVVRFLAVFSAEGVPFGSNVALQSTAVFGVTTLLRIKNVIPARGCAPRMNSKKGIPQ